MSNTNNEIETTKGFEAVIRGYVAAPSDGLRRPNFKVGNQFITDVPVASNFTQWNSATKTNEELTNWVTVKIWSNEPLPKKVIDQLNAKGAFITARGPLQVRPWESKGKHGFNIELIATQKHIQTLTGSSNGMGHAVATDMSPESIAL